ncbi:Uncharacterized protein Adt_21845 [Abeliophyllum distichum]|uniref:Uncharacterized protein n=1 Tax=Abeliophyllum distichum TaxID=126358 RepID=A0ABD1T0J7_9LAMI
MADEIIARIQNLVEQYPPLNFTWQQFCTAIVFMLNIFHRGFIITARDQGTVVFIVPVLGTLMQVKYQGIEKNPFITCSKTMTVAVISLLLYSYLAYGANLKFDLHGGNPPTYAFHCMVFFGNTAVASMTSIFFPDSIRPFLYLLCVFISAGEFLYWVYQRDEHIFPRRIYRFLINLWRWLLAYFSMEHTHILPRYVIPN